MYNTNHKKKHTQIYYTSDRLSSCMSRKVLLHATWDAKIKCATINTTINTSHNQQQMNKLEHNSTSQPRMMQGTDCIGSKFHS